MKRRTKTIYLCGGLLLILLVYSAFGHCWVRNRTHIPKPLCGCVSIDETPVLEVRDSIINRTLCVLFYPFMKSQRPHVQFAEDLGSYYTVPHNILLHFIFSTPIAPPEHKQPEFGNRNNEGTTKSSTTTNQPALRTD